MIPKAPADALPRVLALGLVGGVLSGLFGVGGGTVLVPGLVLLFAFGQHRAHATSLAAIIVTAPAAMLGFALDGAVAYPAALALAVGAVGGAYAGAGVMHRLSPERLRQIFALMVVIAAVRMVSNIEFTPGDTVPAMSAGLLAGLALLGLVAGMLSSVLGVGGGVVMVPAMVLVLGFGQHVAEGTSLLVIVPTALMGAWRHTRKGYTDWRLGLLVGLGGVLGGVVGAQIALALPAAWLQRLFAVMLVYTGLRLLLRRRPEDPPPEP